MYLVQERGDVVWNMHAVCRFADAATLEQTNPSMEYYSVDGLDYIKHRIDFAQLWLTSQSLRL